jgi:hypothetical protein
MYYSYVVVIEYIATSFSPARTDLAVRLFRKRALSLAWAADATMKRRMAHEVKNAPVSLMGLPSLVSHPMKKMPTHYASDVCLG